MISDTNVTSSSFVLHKDLTRSLIAAQVITPVQEIYDFLKRPIRLRTGTWTTSSTGLLNSIDLPYEALHMTMYTPKVLGFLNFRAKVVANLQVNANRFAQGRLIMHFLPQSQINGMYPYNRCLSNILITQQPNVQLDANTETSAILEIPYIAPTLYYDLVSGNGPMGGLYLSVYSPLKYGTGGQSAEYSIWVHFEDVELSVPTAPGVYLTQGGFRSRTSKKRNIADAELSDTPGGPISNGLASLSNIASKFKGVNIPIVSEVAGTVAWVSGMLSGAASFFGFSNPRSEAITTLVTNQPQGNMSAPDIGNASTMLAYSGKNKLETLPGLGATDLDEANLSYLASIQTYFRTFDWLTSDTVDDTLTTFVIGSDDTVFYTDVTVNDGTNNIFYTQYTPVGFLMSYFAYWRGSIRITLKFVKTEFHTGRFSIYYVPNPNSTQVVPTVADSAYCLRDIVDLRDGNEMSFLIPFTSNKPWVDKDDHLGTVYIKVVNSLVAPDAASQTVSVLCEVSAGPDFQVAGLNTWLDNVTNLKPAIIDNTAFFTQMGTPSAVKDTIITNVDETMGGGIIPPNTLSPAKYVMGESINSVYQLVKRPTYFKPIYSGTTSEIAIQPYTLWGIGQGYSSTPYSIGELTGDSLSLFSSFYAYSRGSVDIRWVYLGSTDTGFLATVQRKLNNDPFLYSVTTTLSYATSYTVAKASLNMGLSISAPPYTELHCRLNRVTSATVANGATYKFPDDQYDSDYQLNMFSNTAISATLFRSAGDDYQVGFFCGIPPLARNISAIG